MSSAATTPGLYFEVGAREPDKSPLRSDIAALIGRTRRGPIGIATRVEGWRSFRNYFGALQEDAALPYAIRGYFENGGERAYVVRLANGKDSKIASFFWDVQRFDEDTWQPDLGGFRASQYEIKATSPGKWANGTRVTIRYNRSGALGKPQADVIVIAPDEPVEYLTGLDPAQIKESVNAASRLIQFEPIGEELEGAKDVVPSGKRQIIWNDLILENGIDAPVSQFEYLDAVKKLGDEPEVAMLSMPDLYADITNEDAQKEVLIEAIQQAENLRDRMVLVDLDPTKQDATAAMKWIDQMLKLDDETILRAAAVYHPLLRVSDPLGGVASPLRNVPPSGHVAGVISWMDRIRGAHHTPANMELYEAVDIEQGFELETQGKLIERGINLVRCSPGRGLQVWGGRTLSTEFSSMYIAHRRLIHRLVRAIRRVAEPLVFDTNGPTLWLKLFRAITTILLEAFRAGALKGSRPEEAFRVTCDETTNPIEEQELGRVLCTIEVAPAVPMEFITLRILFGTDATLEVFEQ